MISKLPKVETTIFTTMSQLAKEHGALNLSQGFPDFPVSAELIELVHKAMKDGLNQYAPMGGWPKLTAQLADILSNNYNTKFDAQKNITVTAGATEALFVAIQTVIHPGDEVILFDPAYDSYAPAVKLAGGICRHIDLEAPDFQIPWEQVKDTVSDKTKLIIVNSPHNPSGSVISSSDLDELEQLVHKYNLFVLSDEVYERIVFDNVTHQSVLSREALRAKSMAVYSFGKTFHATGWKIGYVVAPEKLTTEMRKVHQYVTFSVNTPMQEAIASYLENENNYLQLGHFYEQKRERFVKAVSASRFKVLGCSGTYFQLLDYSEISDQKEVEMARMLTEKHKIASIPVAVFYKSGRENRVLRFCFAKKNETLDKAAEILCKI